MWIADVPTQQINPPAIYMAANTVTAKSGNAASVYKMGVCEVINEKTNVYPTSDAGSYFYKFMNKEMSFEYYPDGSLRTDTSVRIIKQPKHGRLVQAYPGATDTQEYNYKYIPDEGTGNIDHFVMEAKAGGITVQIYYTMSYVGLGQPTYVFDENNQQTDNLDRCPKSSWKISLQNTPADTLAIESLLSYTGITSACNGLIMLDGLKSHTTTDRRPRRNHHATTQTVHPRLQAGNSQADGGAELHPCASLRGRRGGGHRREALAAAVSGRAGGYALTEDAGAHPGDAGNPAVKTTY